MVAPSNLKFATAGSSPGDAAGWVRVSVSAATGFGSYDGRRAEGFETWASPYRFVGFMSGDLVAGNVEGFELWVGGQDQYRFNGFDGADLVRGVYNFVAHIDPGDPAEGFERKWGADGYLFTSFTPGVHTVAGQYDSGAHAFEGFEHWTATLATEYRFFGRSGGDVVHAPFSRGTEVVEKFRSVTDCAFSVFGPPTATLSSSESTLQVDDVVNLVTTGTLPSPGADATPYYVVASTPGASFQLSLSKGGSPITWTSAGSGVHTATADLRYGWGPPIAF